MSMDDINPPRGTPTALDELEAGLLSRAAFEEQIMAQVFAGLHQYCEIPAGYRHCVLATRELDIDAMDDRSLRSLLRHPPPEIINPYRAHIKAIELFEMLLSGDSMVCDHGDPLNPTIGAYLHGPPGSGKTHLMAAYGLGVQTLLADKLTQVQHMVGEMIEEAFTRYTLRQATESKAEEEDYGMLEVSEDGVISSESLPPTDEFWATVSSIKARVQAYHYQPTDLLYLGFKELVEICKYSSQRSDAIHAMENARVVLIDDVHPQGDPEQVQIVLNLLERRYEQGRPGTFITTNLETSQISGDDEMLSRRLLSRCAEMLVSIDFADCDDWRQLVKARRVRLIEDELDKRIDTHAHLVDPEEDEGDDESDEEHSRV